MSSTAQLASRSFFENHGVAVRGELEGRQLRLWQFAVSENVALPRHRHESALLLFLVRGRLSCSCRREPYQRWLGVFHPPGAEHECELRGAQGVAVELGPRWLQRLDQHEAVPTRAVALEPQSRWIATRLVEEFRSPRLAGTLMIEGLLAQLLASTARADPDPALRLPVWFPNLLARLHSDFSSGARLHELAAEFDIHPARLSLLFRRHFGVTLGAYARDLRVEFLLDRLAESEQSMADLMLAAGFADQSHGTNEFKSLTGMTPSTYRRLLRDGSRREPARSHIGPSRGATSSSSQELTGSPSAGSTAQ